LIPACLWCLHTSLQAAMQPRHAYDLCLTQPLACTRHTTRKRPCRFYG